MQRTDRRHLLLTDHWYQPLIVQRHNPVVSDSSRERITAAGLHGKSDEGIVAFVAGSATTKSGHADGAKALWLVLVNVK